MRRLILLLVLALAVPAATAHAGGWATVEVAKPPAGVSAGEVWRAELLIKQHGITPLEDVKPSVEIRDGAGAVRTFEARPAGRPGTYVADVVYPSAGTWSTRFYDGFTNATPHRLAPLTVGAAEPAAPPAQRAAAPAEGFPEERAAAIAIVALLWIGGGAAGWWWSRRARRRYLPTS